MRTLNWFCILVDPKAIAIAFCCAWFNVSHFAARASNTSEALLYSVIVFLRLIPTFASVVSTSDSFSVVPSSSTSSNFPAFILVIRVRIDFIAVPTVLILCCVTSPIVATYPSRRSIEIPAWSAVTATRDIASASPLELTAALRSTFEILSTTDIAFSASSWYPFRLAVKYFVASSADISPTFEKITEDLTRLFTSSMLLPCLNQASAPSATAVPTVPNSAPRFT